MEGSLWWQWGAVYEVYVRSFQDSDGDGVGDLAGIIQRLPYLSDGLGVDALWLTPFYRSPMADFGYDVADHTDVDPLFGDLATFDRLVEEAHKRGLKLIVDYVPNHTSDRHPWFLESRSSRHNPKRDWYIWRNPKPDGSLPNNWLSMFGGPAWEWDGTTEQFYLHSFLKQQPDLNWRNPEVKEAMFDVARFWLERGVDGFRIDVAQFVMKDPELRDNPPNPEPIPHFGPWGEQLHLHDFGHPDVHIVYRDLRRLLDSYSAERPRMSIGELHHRDPKVWAGYYGEQLDELHMPFNFHLLRTPWDAQAVRTVVDSIEAALPGGAWPNWVLGNHDRPRVASRVGQAHARVAMMMLLTLRGAPTLYYGDEIGMTDVRVPPERARDPWETNLPGLGRDPERTPMQWDASPNSGFCPPGVQPWLPLAADYERVNAATQLDDPRSMLSLTRALLDLRRRCPALLAGRYAPVEEAPSDCYVYERRAGDQRFVVALNFSGEERVLHLEGLGDGGVALSTLLDRDERVGMDGLRLRPNEGCVVEMD